MTNPWHAALPLLFHADWQGAHPMAGVLHNHDRAVPQGGDAVWQNCRQPFREPGNARVVESENDNAGLVSM